MYSILQGDMSFIGHRPERKVFIREFQKMVPVLREGTRIVLPLGLRHYTGLALCLSPKGAVQSPFYSYRLSVSPGVTGWAQVMFPQAGSSMEDLKEKLQYDLYYIKNMGFLLDLAILMKTIRIVLFGHGK
jgi:lipopolysaccharide/colanic/teichoic acid biosynthesis glycosyltransferase